MSHGSAYVSSSPIRGAKPVMYALCLEIPYFRLWNYCKHCREIGARFCVLTTLVPGVHSDFHDGYPKCSLSLYIYMSFVALCVLCFVLQFLFFVCVWCFLGFGVGGISRTGDSLNSPCALPLGRSPFDEKNKVIPTTWVTLGFRDFAWTQNQAVLNI